MPSRTGLHPKGYLTLNSAPLDAPHRQPGHDVEADSASASRAYGPALGQRVRRRCFRTAAERDPMAKVAAKPRKEGGIVVTYSPPEQGYADSHENATRIEIGKSLAALKGFEFAGEYDPSARHDGPVYFVPSDALPIDTGLELGIYTENDLFGGIVPHAFAATKAITHTLVDPDAHAPAGWSHGFGGRVRAAVLMGFTAFALEDARRAGAKLLERGPVRIKPVREAGGRGQFVASAEADLLATLDAMDPSELACSGVVLEENLSEVTTYSVGRVRVADLLASYYGCHALRRIAVGQLFTAGVTWLLSGETLKQYSSLTSRRMCGSLW